MPTGAWLLGDAMAGTAVWIATHTTVPPPRVSRLLITPPSGAALTTNSATQDVGITPDGTRVVYTGANGTALFVRKSASVDHASAGEDRRAIGIEDVFSGSHAESVIGMKRRVKYDG